MPMLFWISVYLLAGISSSVSATAEENEVESLTSSRSDNYKQALYYQRPNNGARSTNNLRLLEIHEENSDLERQSLENVADIMDNGKFDARSIDWHGDSEDGENDGGYQGSDSEEFSQEARRLTRRLDRSHKEILETILKGYDLNEWPHFYYGKRTDVHVQMFINAFGSLNAASMDFQIDVFLRQMWQDPRLAYSDKREYLTVMDEETHRRIWKPDTFFDNVKVAHIHAVTVPNVVMRITKMGDIMYTMRLALVLTCNMQLRLYPFDTQYCYIDLSSLSSTEEIVSYHWHDNLPIKILADLEIAEFDLIDTSTTETKLEFATGNFSGIQARFTLRRQNGYHLLQTYVPTIIIVCMSWLSFWIEPDHVPGRVTLCVTTLLTLTTLAGGVRQSLPRVSYVKAVDVWLVVCMLMVFAVLIEFTVVNSLATRKKDPRLYKSPSGPMKQPSKTYISQARRIDEFSRALFPAFFFLFNVFYWTYYILRLYQEVNKTPFTY